jgi:lipooligosaccharide transport system ATP-binding protein
LELPIVIEAANLTKKYGDLIAVNAINFKVYKGECFGFLGPNGAGKTTTVKMIHCVLPITSGGLYVSGMDVKEKEREIKSIIGVAPQETNLDTDFTTIRNLLIYSRYFDIPEEEALKKARELIGFLHLEEKKNVVIDNLSGGMKKRLILARALINDPEILILDEPTTGLDPQGRHLIWDTIGELKKRGVTIILTTHYMEEAAQLCDRLVIMDNGKIIEEGEPSELVKKHIGEKVLEVPSNKEITEYLHTTCPDAKIEAVGEKIHISSSQCEILFPEILEKFFPHQASMRDANLEDVFLKLTGRGLRD